jgi:putative transposase
MLLQSVGRRYVRYINQAYRRSGTLWEGRYKSALIDSDRYLLTCSRYIELNPVRTGMVTFPGEYRWSSFRSNGGAAADPLLSPHPLYTALGNSPATRAAAYRALFDRHLDAQDIQAIRDNTETGVVLGNERFKNEVKSILQRRVERQPHGGDRKSGDFRKRRLSEIN